jgi:hypothetical protein
MNIHILSKFLYGLTGIILLIIGVGVVLFKSGVLPQTATDGILRATDNNMYGLHLLQEFGALMVFGSLICFWFIRNYEHSLGFHWALTIFFALLALVHWFDVRGMQPSLMGPMVNTIPVILFVTVGIFRRGK